MAQDPILDSAGDKEKKRENDGRTRPTFNDKPSVFSTYPRMAAIRSQQVSRRSVTAQPAHLPDQRTTDSILERLKNRPEPGTSTAVQEILHRLDKQSDSPVEQPSTQCRDINKVSQKVPAVRGLPHPNSLKSRTTFRRSSAKVTSAVDVHLQQLKRKLSICKSQNGDIQSMVPPNPSTNLPQQSNDVLKLTNNYVPQQMSNAKQQSNNAPEESPPQVKMQRWLGSQYNGDQFLCDPSNMPVASRATTNSGNCDISQSSASSSHAVNHFKMPPNRRLTRMSTPYKNVNRVPVMTPAVCGLPHPNSLFGKNKGNPTFRPNPTKASNSVETHLEQLKQKLSVYQTQFPICSARVARSDNTAESEQDDMQPSQYSAPENSSDFQLEYNQHPEQHRKHIGQQRDPKDYFLNHWESQQTVSNSEENAQQPAWNVRDDCQTYQSPLHQYTLNSQVARSQQNPADSGVSSSPYSFSPSLISPRQVSPQSVMPQQLTSQQHISIPPLQQYVIAPQLRQHTFALPELPQRLPPLQQRQQPPQQQQQQPRLQQPPQQQQQQPRLQQPPLPQQQQPPLLQRQQPLLQHPPLQQRQQPPLQQRQQPPLQQRQEPPLQQQQQPPLQHPLLQQQQPLLQHPPLQQRQQPPLQHPILQQQQQPPALQQYVITPQRQQPSIPQHSGVAPSMQQQQFCATRAQQPALQQHNHTTSLQQFHASSSQHLTSDGDTPEDSEAYWSHETGARTSDSDVLVDGFQESEDPGEMSYQASWQTQAGGNRGNFDCLYGQQQTVRTSEQVHEARNFNVWGKTLTGRWGQTYFMSDNEDDDG